jgi:hypothetical protein
MAARKGTFNGVLGMCQTDPPHRRLDLRAV